MKRITWTAFNPIQNIRTKITTAWDIDGDGTDERVIDFTYPDGPYTGDTCSVPIYTTMEARTGELPTMPFIEMILIDAPGAVHNISGNVRREEAYIDMNIYAADTDEINNMDTWMINCKNDIVNLIMTNRNAVSSCTWVEPIDTGRELVERDGKLVVFHHIVSLYALDYEIG